MAEEGDLRASATTWSAAYDRTIPTASGFERLRDAPGPDARPACMHATGSASRTDEASLE